MKAEIPDVGQASIVEYWFHSIKGPAFFSFFQSDIHRMPLGIGAYIDFRCYDINRPKARMETVSLWLSVRSKKTFPRIEATRKIRKPSLFQVTPSLGVNEFITLLQCSHLLGKEIRSNDLMKTLLTLKHYSPM